MLVLIKNPGLPVCHREAVNEALFSSRDNTSTCCLAEACIRIGLTVSCPSLRLKIIGSIRPSRGVLSCLSGFSAITSYCRCKETSICPFHESGEALCGRDGTDRGTRVLLFPSLADAYTRVIKASVLFTVRSLSAVCATGA